MKQRFDTYFPPTPGHASTESSALETVPRRRAWSNKGGVAGALRSFWNSSDKCTETCDFLQRAHARKLVSSCRCYTTKNCRELRIPLLAEAQMFMLSQGFVDFFSHTHAPYAPTCLDAKCESQGTNRLRRRGP